MEAPRRSGPLDEDAMRRVLLDAVYDVGSQSAFARQAGVSPWTVSKALNGHRPVGRRIAAHLGFEVTVRYERRGAEG